MEKRVAIISADYAHALEVEINNFLQDVSGKLHEIKFSIIPDEFVALLIYTPDSNE